MRFIFIISLSALLLQVSAQTKRFKLWMDTVQMEENSYFEQYDYKSFFVLGETQDQIDFENIDQELLDACVFYAINKNRKKLHRKQLTHSQELYKTASVYTQYSSSYAFDGDKRDIKNADKVIKYFAMKNDFNCAQLNTTVTLCQLMDKKPLQKFHYNRKKDKNEESDLGLYKRSVKRINDSTVVREELNPMTYVQFAEYITRYYIKRQLRTMRSKAWTSASCSVIVDPRTLHKNKLPSAKIVYVLAGQRTALIEEEDD
jgi:hypothetical protein